MSHRFMFRIIGVAAFLVSASLAASTIWKNEASSNRIEAIDSNTGTVLKSFTPGKGNGRGIVVVGNTVYYTVAGSNQVFKLDATTGADLGIAFSIAGASGLSAISYDGTNFYIADYSGTKNAYLVSPSGTLIKTIVLSLCSSFCDGLEFFNGKLISNRGDNLSPGTYDIYDLNGGVITPSFIIDNHGVGSRGVAFDGTNFIVASGTLISTYSGANGAFISSIPASTGLIEDVSFDFAQRPDTGGPPADLSVPTLSEWALILLTLIIAVFAIRPLMQRRLSRR
jgi:DNA-binding beta-propeller fold protein YncE